MRNVESIVASIVIGLLIYLWFRGKEMRLGRQLSFVTYSKERKEKCDAFLVTQHASYYNLLSAKNRLTFVNRTLFILDEKTFIEREGFLFTEERKMKIAATLVQLTFGLGSEFADLSSFEFIVIYPSKFFSKLIGTDVKGLAVSNGQIFLSWEDFRKGFENSSDKINLGLHEFSHALDMELDRAENEAFKIWKIEGVRVLTRIVDENIGVFRAYSSTNIHELWACVIETFFEAPMEFEKEYPILYDRTCTVLGQDMVKLLAEKNYLY